MNSGFKLFKKVIRSFDVFPTTQFLKYNQQNQYKTATGGLVTIFIVSIIMVLFFSAGFRTLEKSQISSTMTTVYQSNPSLLQLQMPQDKFMLAIMIIGLNLNNKTAQWLNFTLTQDYYKPVMKYINSTVIPLEACTDAHFDFDADILAKYKKYSQNTWLCPKYGSTMILQGKTSSDIFSCLTLTISKCDITKNPACVLPIAITNFINTYKQFVVGIPFVTSIVNSNDQVYKTYVIEDRNYFTFSPTSSLGIRVNGYLSSYTIKTDNSILPYEDKLQDTGLVVKQLFDQKQTNAFTIDPSIGIPLADIYGRFSLNKSPIVFEYTRSFKKLDQFFSYVGGLIGTIFVLFFIITAYNEIAYQISLSANLFDYNQETPVQSAKFNFFYFIAMFLKSILDFLKYKRQWPVVTQFQQCQQQMEKQLDITYILKRIIFLEESLQMILEPHQHQLLHLQPKLTLQDLILMRHLHESDEQFQKNLGRKIANTSPNSNTLSPNPPNVNVRDEVSINSDGGIVKQDKINQNCSQLEKSQFSLSLQTDLLENLKRLIREAKIGNSVSLKIAKKLKIPLQDEQKQKKYLTKVITMKSVYFKQIHNDQQQQQQNK